MRQPDKQELKALTSIEWGVTTYWQTMTDEQLATGLSTTVEIIKQTRADLNLVRPTGEQSMKEAARDYLFSMSPLEKRMFLKSIDPDKLWEMAEGKAATTGTLEIKQEPVRIDITHHLLKAYGPIDGARIIDMPHDSEGSRLAEGSS